MWGVSQAEVSFGELVHTKLRLCLEREGRRMAVDSGHLSGAKSQTQEGTMVKEMLLAEYRSHSREIQGCRASRIFYLVHLR